VGDHHHRVAELGVNFHDAVLQVRPGQRIERPERLVQQQHLGLHGRRPGDTHPLFHAAGNRGRAFVFGVGHVDEGEVGHHPLAPFLGRALAGENLVHRQDDVSVNGQPRQQGVVLEHHGPVRSRRLHRRAIDDHRAGGHR